MKSYKEYYAVIDQKLVIQDFEGAISKIRNAKNKYYKEKERVLYYLDLGMLHHYNRDYEKSNELLSKAENAIEELYTKSISRAAVSLVINDNVLEYGGEDYENIYLNIFKALNYLGLNKFDDAFVEIRRINNKLQLLEDKYEKKIRKYNLSKNAKSKYKAGKINFHNSALARYLSLLLYRAENKQDDARIDLDKIREAWNSQSGVYDFKMPAMKNYLNRTDKARINFISFIGKSPDKKAKALYIHTEKNLLVIASTDENPRGKQKLENFQVIPWDGIQEGYHFKFQIPYMNERKTNIGKVKVIIDDEPVFTMEQIESIENIAVETFKIKEPIIYLKTITRAVTKGLFAEKRKEEMTEKINSSLLSFGVRLIADAIIDASENADLRISRFFPAEALIGEIEIEPGIHNIKIQYFSQAGILLYTDNIGEKNIKYNELNLIESFNLN